MRETTITMNCLERARLDAGLTHAGLSDAIREQTGATVNQSTIRRMEAGTRVPQVAKLKAVADYLGFAPSELMAEIRATQRGTA